MTPAGRAPAPAALDDRPLYRVSAPRRRRADQATVRRNNLGLVLRHLRDHGPRSRARIAEETGLNKATVSSLVAELAERRLVSTGGVERPRSVGRPGVPVQVAGRSVCGIGVELNVDHASVVALDLRGEVLHTSSAGIDVRGLGPERTLDQVAALVTEAVAAVGSAGAVPVGVTVAVPGLVRSTDGVVVLGPNLGWRDVVVREALVSRLQARFPVRVENDANLSAIAEWAMGTEAGTPDLVYLAGEVGVGGGVIAGGQLLRGAGGFAGEVGHTGLGDPQVLCGCGRRGCWETVVGLAALLRGVADPGDPVHDPSRDLPERLAEVDWRARAGDARTLAALTRVGAGLGAGTAALINLFNPRVVVLGGYFAVLGRWFSEPLAAELESRVLAPRSAWPPVVLSTLGFSAAARGGAHVALEAVFDDPTRVPTPPPAHQA